MNDPWDGGADERANVTLLTGRSDVAVLPTTRRPWWVRPAAWYGLFAAALFGIGAWSLAWLPFVGPRPPRLLPSPWLDGWYRWDAGWYAKIASHGYSYLGPHRQSSVAYFPGYPTLMRVLGWPFQNPVAAGLVITLVGGGVATVLFFLWTRRFCGEEPARWSVALLLCYPFAFYLAWTVYPDAMFIALALGAFLCIERDQVVPAALLGVVATATRPLGPALVAGLVLRAWERRRSGQGSRWWWLSAVAVSGWLGFLLFQWARFGTPFASTMSESAPGWGHAFNLHTLFKDGAVWILTHGSWDISHTTVVLGGAASVLALALVPAVRRRFGTAYAVYSLLALLLPLVVSPDFIGMGRYVMSAFPCIAVAGTALANRPSLATAVCGGSALGLVVLTSLFVRGAYLS